MPGGQKGNVALEKKMRKQQDESQPLTQLPCSVGAQHIPQQPSPKGQRAPYTPVITKKWPGHRMTGGD